MYRNDLRRALLCAEVPIPHLLSARVNTVRGRRGYVAVAVEEADRLIGGALRRETARHRGRDNRRRREGDASHGNGRRSHGSVDVAYIDQYRRRIRRDVVVRIAVN